MRDTPPSSSESRFRALSNTNYRIWMGGVLVSFLGTWMQRTAQDWLVLTVLTHHSGVAVGITTALQYLPPLLLSAHAGVLADRLPKRTVLYVTQSLMGLSALATGLLVVTGQARLWNVFVCAFVLGVGAAFDKPTRLALVSELVPREHVLSAVGMNTTCANLARLIGPALTGVLIAAWGTGPAFLANAASFGATIVALACLDTSLMRPTPTLPKKRGQIVEGFRYVGGRPDLVLVFCLTGVVSTFGLNYQLTNALMATGAFHRGAASYGLLGSMIAIGSLGGALTSARRSQPKLTLLVTATLGFGGITLLSALSPSYLLFAVLLIPTGLASITFLNTANGLIQLSTAPQLRGRVLALYVAIKDGTNPIGAPIVGWIGSAAGARTSVGLGGLLAVLAGIAAVAALRLRPHVEEEFANALEVASQPSEATS